MRAFHEGVARAATVGASCALLLFGAAHDARGAGGEAQLVRVGGTVQYQSGGQDPFHDVFGQRTLTGEATAVTLADSRALVRLLDSSEIDVGARSRFRVGALEAAANDAPTVVRLELGAMHFTVRHPAGGRANYRFETPTSQIAVRGTEGYIVTGPSGTDIYCADCGPDDAMVAVGARTFPLRTGQQLFVYGAEPARAAVEVVARPCTNPAAIAISDGKLGKNAAPATLIDTTGALGGDPLRPVRMPAPSPAAAATAGPSLY